MSLREGGPRKFENWRASFVDGAGGKSVIDRMWHRMRPVTVGTITVTLDQTRDAVRLIAENPGQSPRAPVRCRSPQRSRSIPGRADRLRRVGGNIDLAKFAELVAN